ncbi:unnamed protein product [Rhizoctonia solani]|uniref:Uncharacterized protein n=1 Tax=Rhizoctonia solani TaxID=456999 RepID=A0A8H3D9I4_9AGAM|nr:unnamed protein product [Rhizoctonia solani]CAE6516418.1 unnamed protein product [Rhizoctonia solani]
MVSPLHQLTFSLCVPYGQRGEETRFILVSSVVDTNWNIELGCQEVRDRWWRGSHPLPEVAIQAELASRWSRGIIQILGWRGAISNVCMLKSVFNLSQALTFRIPLKEYEPEIASTRAMRILLSLSMLADGRNICPIPPRPPQNISVTDIHLRQREQTIQELRHKIASLEKDLESRPLLTTTPTALPKVHRLASLANPPKRRRVIKDMRFDGE